MSSAIERYRGGHRKTPPRLSVLRATLKIAFAVVRQTIVSALFVVKVIIILFAAVFFHLTFVALFSQHARGVGLCVGAILSLVLVAPRPALSALDVLATLYLRLIQVIWGFVASVLLYSPLGLAAFMFLNGVYRNNFEPLFLAVVVAAGWASIFWDSSPPLPSLPVREPIEIPAEEAAIVAAQALLNDRYGKDNQ